MNRVLVVAVHPDDETLGCGGTLLKHKENGDEIHWLIATEIIESKDYSRNIINDREDEISQVSKFYNFDSVNRLGLSSTMVDTYSMNEIINKISIIINKIKPNIIFIPFKGDVHTDHKVIFEATFSCTKSFRYPFIKKIYMMETLSETEFSPSFLEESFVPNVFVDVTKYIERKINAMKLYKSEIGKHPFPRSEANIRALSTYRGATCGHINAEAFLLLKEIQ